MSSSDRSRLISDLQVILVSLPFQQPVVTMVERETAEHKTIVCVVVQVLTESGPAGVGIAWTFGLPGARAIQHLIGGFSTFVVGEDPMMSERIWSRLWRKINPLGHAGVALIALSALDIAIWDLRGKITNTPVYKLLGGYRSELPAYASGLFLSSTLEEIIEEAKSYVAAGFRAIKMRVGSNTLEEDVERVEAVRRAVGPGVTLMIDAAQAWDTNQAMRACRALERFDLGWIEDPVPFDNVDALAALAGALDTPITTGEKLYSRYAFRQLLERRAADILMPDVQRVGGVTEWMRVAALAESWDVPIVAHVLPEISAHLLAATTSALSIEYIGWLNPLFRRSLLPTSTGTIVVPDSPGFGFELDADTITRHRIS